MRNRYAFSISLCVIGLYILSAGSPAHAQGTQIVSRVADVRGGGYTGPPLPTYSLTFAYTIPSGYQVVGADISGTWGNSYYPYSTAGVDISLEGVLVAQCVKPSADCWATNPAGPYTRPWSASLPSSMFAALADGSAPLALRQTSPSTQQTQSEYVEVGSLTLTLTVAPAPLFGQITLPMIQSASLSTSSINSSSLSVGKIVLYRTDQGRYGKMMVQQIGYDLVLQWVTYDASGAIYSSGSDLAIRGTYTCDLDAGAETATLGPPTDFHWNILIVAPLSARMDPYNGARQGLFSGCLYALSPTSATLTYVAQSGTVAVSSLPTCAWAAGSDVAWITVTSGESGVDDGTVGYSVTQNPGPGSRSGSMTIAGRTFTVTQAAPPTASVTVTTNPPGRTFTVDSIGYSTAQTFTWVVGSSHTIGTSSPQSAAGTRYVFAGWSDGQALTHPITVPAGGITYTANFTTQFLLTSTPSPAGGGSISVTPTSADGYYNSGTSVQLTAVPAAGYTFSGWTGDLTGTANPQSLTMSAPRSVTANFALGNASVTIATNPSGRDILIDNVRYTAPQTISMVVGSTHSIGTYNPQITGSTRYSFTAWNDGSTQLSRTITIPAGPITYTANFTTQYMLGSSASPSNGGSINIAPSSADRFYTAGTIVQLTAIPAAGYTFSGWTGDLTGSANPQSLTMSVPRVVTANFSLIPAGITVNTNPEGRSFTVDGQSYSSAQTFSWAPGSTHTIATGSPQTAAGTRFLFANWSDSGALSHSITTPSGSAIYTANFTTQYLLTLTASPPENGTVNASPSSADGFYNSGQAVQLTAIPSGGVFTGWSGDLTGTANPQSILMSAPRSVTAVFGCAYSITPLSGNHTAAGGSGNVAVTASAGCPWSASSNSAWITITSGSTGTGPGAVRYSVSSNTSSSQRTGSITIAGIQFAVVQSGALTPVISSLQPPKATAGTPGFNLIVTGSNFMNGSAVLWSGLPRPTTYIGVTELRAAISSADISIQGTAQVTVATPGAGNSASMTFTILPVSNPWPEVAGTSPGRMIRGGQGFTLSVYGAGFVPASKVRWNGQDRPTTFESGTHLSAVIPASDLAVTGTALVTVFNPSPGGGNSAAVTFEILAGTVITDISPTMVAPLGKGLTLTLFGANFLSGSTIAPGGAIRRQTDTLPTVLWNGQPLNTVMVSSEVLQATVPASLVGNGGNALVSVSGGSGGASNTVPIPITVTQPAPMLSALSPNSIVPGSTQFTLTLQGKNFVEGSKVLWNGEERQTQFLDSTRVQAIIPAGDVTTVGVSQVSVLNPSPGGGESNGQYFNHVQSLLFPRLSNANRVPGSATDDSERTGLAFTNLGARDETVTLTAFDTGGAPLSGPGITNPAQITINPSQQLAIAAFQVFGSGLSDAKPIGWFKMESSGSAIPGFFLMYSDTLSLLDGTDVSSTTHTTLIAPEIAPAGFTQLTVLNPDVQEAQLEFELHGANGEIRSSARQTLPPNASLAAAVADLFPSVAADVSDYVRVVSNRGVLLFEYMGKPNQDVAALNGQDGDAGGTVLYSPQYAVGGGLWRTALSVVNLESRSGVVTFTLRGNGGEQLAAPVVRAIPANGKISISDQKFFLDPGNDLKVGYVEIRSDGVHLAGSVIFGDAGQRTFESCLPLVSRLQTDMLFSQLASDQQYYTGLAIINPNPVAVTAHIEVFDKEGALLASKDEPLGAAGRVVDVITEFFPQLRGENHTGGYIRVRADRGVASFALFGSLTSLSAVPAQEIR